VTYRQTGRRTALLLAATLASAACGGAASSPGTSTDPGTSQSPTAEPLSGEIVISGSSTVLPISQLVAETFNETYPDVAISVDGPGTGDGFKLFCAGETDISNASRKIKDAENELCATGGVEYIELKVAIDGMSILTSKDNSSVTCLFIADLYALVGPESEGFDSWADGEAIATELGSTSTLPDAPLTISGPGEESGTYDYFVEAVITKTAEARSQENATRKDYQSSPNDNVIIEGIGGSDTSLGWVGYAYAAENLDTVKLLEVARTGEACVAPTKETIASGDYPLARDLYIYVSKTKAADNAALAAFVDFYLAEGTVATVNETAGYIDLAAEVLAESRSAWEMR
jgi:phosphate transport system substrate-binding protein